MICYADKTFCASQNCKNECGRAINELQRMDARIKNMPISWGYFCGEPDIDPFACEHQWDGKLINTAYAANLGLCKLCGQKLYIALTE